MSKPIQSDINSISPSLSDAELVRLAQNDLKHFGLLYEKHWESVFRFIFKRVGDEAKVKDLVQDVFYKAMININKYEDRGYAFTSWLFRIALNEAANLARKNKVDMTFKANSQDLVSLMNEVYDEERDQLEDRVKDILSGLRDAEIQLIQMRYFEKRKLVEVAQILNISESNCKVKMFRIMTKLRKKINFE